MICRGKVNEYTGNGHLRETGRHFLGDKVGWCPDFGNHDFPIGLIFHVLLQRKQKHTNEKFKMEIDKHELQF